MTVVSRFRQAERTAARVIEGAAYVVSVDKQMMIELNEVGTVVWEVMSRPSSLDELIEVVAERFEIEPAVAREDVGRFLQTLVERGVVVTESGQE